MIRVSENWDKYFLRMAREAASNSKCKSKTGKKGAVIAYGKKFVSTGYSGPPAGIPECWERIPNVFVGGQMWSPVNMWDCPRAVLSLQSGQNLDMCLSCHAEVNAIIFAYRDLSDHTLYLWSPVMPCKVCAGYIINSGIKRVVGLTATEYETNAYARVEPMFKQANVRYDIYDCIEHQGGLDG